MLATQMAQEIEQTLEELDALKRLSPQTLALEGRMERLLQRAIRRWRREVVAQVGPLMAETRSPVSTAVEAAWEEAFQPTVEAGALGRRETLAALGIRVTRSVGKQQVAIALDEVSAQVNAELTAHAFEASQRTMERMRGSVMRTLRQAYQDGVGTRVAADRLHEVFDGMRDFEVERIARTEVNSAQNRSAQMTLDEFDVEYEQWVTTIDGRTRDSHVAQNNLIARRGKRFPNGLLHPGDMSGAPEEFINCRCRIVPFILGNRVAPPGLDVFRESDLRERQEVQVISQEPSLVTIPDTSAHKYTAGERADFAKWDKLDPDLRRVANNWLRDPAHMPVYGRHEELIPHVRRAGLSLEGLAKDRYAGFYHDSLARTFVRSDFPAAFKREVVQHELGHQVHLSMYREAKGLLESARFDARVQTLYSQAMSNVSRGGTRAGTRGTITKYAQTNHKEYFAESFMYFVRNPVALKSIDSAMYRFLNSEVFKGLYP